MQAPAPMKFLWRVRINSGRYERGDGRTDPAVLRDFMPVTSAWPQAVKSGGDFEIATPGGGRWIGTVMSMAGKPILAVRTYVD
jgi:hypothetical protein